MPSCMWHQDVDVTPGCACDARMCISVISNSTIIIRSFTSWKLQTLLNTWWIREKRRLSRNIDISFYKPCVSILYTLCFHFIHPVFSFYTLCVFILYILCFHCIYPVFSDFCVNLLVTFLQGFLFLWDKEI